MAPIRLNSKNPLNPFHPARSAMFFKSPSAWLFIKHAVRFFSATQWRTFSQGIESMSTQLFEKIFRLTSELARNVQINILSKGSVHGFIPFFYYMFLSDILLTSYFQTSPPPHSMCRVSRCQTAPQAFSRHGAPSSLPGNVPGCPGRPCHSRGSAHP